MTDYWASISEEAYKAWLLDAGINAPRYNGASIVEVRTLRTQFLQQRSLQLYRLVFDETCPGSSGIPCIHHDLEEYPLDQLRKLEIPKNEKISLYRFYHVLGEEAQGQILYSRELHVQTQLENVLKDVIKSCKFPLKTDLEASLNGLRVDIGVVRNSNDVLCGTVEVKSPKRDFPQDPDPMDPGKVITQVVSQMIPVGTMYGVKNVYGVLSTYSQWRFFKWEPHEEDISTSMTDRTPTKAASRQFQTPVQTRVQSAHHGARKSPRMSPKPYVESGSILGENGQDEALDAADSAKGNTVRRGVVYATDVLPAGPQALQLLAWVLGEMAHSPVDKVPAHERDLLYAVQKDALGGYERVPHDIDFYKGRMPSSRNTKLYFLDELGHRYHGRVFRAMSRNGNLCVLKYFAKTQSCRDQDGKRVEASTDVVARKSVEYWNKVYRGWLPQCYCGKWGGGDALIMPDLEKMSLQVDRSFAIELLRTTMKVKFYDKGLWHGDPSWRNVAVVRDLGGQLTKVVMIDLEPRFMIEMDDEMSDWGDFETMWRGFQQKLEQDLGPFATDEASD